MIREMRANQIRFDGQKNELLRECAELKNKLLGEKQDSESYKKETKNRRFKIEKLNKMLKIYYKSDKRFRNERRRKSSTDVVRLQV